MRNTGRKSLVRSKKKRRSSKKRPPVATGIPESVTFIRNIVRAALVVGEDEDADEVGRSRASLKKLFDAIDVDMSGEIDLEEFSTFVTEQATKIPGGSVPEQEDIKEAFAFIEFHAAEDASRPNRDIFCSFIFSTSVFLNLVF